MSNLQYLYRHFDKEGVLLYVGISIDPFNRLRQHKHVSRWFDQITKVTIEHYDSREEVAEAELIAIKTENPLYNISGSDFKSKLTVLKQFCAESEDGLLKKTVGFNPFYTKPSAASLLGVGTPAINYWIKEGLLHHIELPQPESVKIVISGWEIINFIETLESEYEHKHHNSNQE